MKVICTNIGPEELGGQVEWQGLASNYSQSVDNTIKTAFVKNEETGEYTESSRIADGHIFVYELDDDDRRSLAQRQIFKYYPDWRQLDVMRRGTEAEKATMDTFIDACRDWSNDSSNNDPFGLDSVEP
jgi:hypothetical protein